MTGKIISLVGCPAAGKTFLADKLSDYYGAEMIYEKPDDDFPQEITNNLATQSNLFETIVWFRNQQIKNYERAMDLKEMGKDAILDTPFYQNQLFVELYVADEFKKRVLYDMGKIDRNKYHYPDCTIYISATSEEIKSFLKKRKNQRYWENNKWIDFIVKMASLTEDYMDSIKDEIPNLIKIKRNEYDFCIPEHFEYVVSKINLLLKY